MENSFPQIAPAGVQQFQAFARSLPVRALILQDLLDRQGARVGCFIEVHGLVAPMETAGAAPSGPFDMFVAAFGAVPKQQDQLVRLGHGAMPQTIA
ncbi:MAG: hypothetical protein EA001_12940 [Oscillatoriales cyanobacterium]|nr:MAG: hypothetical protein EA001_12940 [Oscillatoriales cyanobacterium]